MRICCVGARDFSRDCAYRTSWFSLNNFCGCLAVCEIKSLENFRLYGILLTTHHPQQRSLMCSPFLLCICRFKYALSTRITFHYPSFDCRIWSSKRQKWVLIVSGDTKNRHDSVGQTLDANVHNVHVCNAVLDVPVIHADTCTCMVDGLQHNIFLVIITPSTRNLIKCVHWSNALCIQLLQATCGGASGIPETVHKVLCSQACHGDYTCRVKIFSSISDSACVGFLGVIWH